MSIAVPERLAIRPATLGDFDSVLALIIAQDMAAYGESMITAESLRSAWEPSNLDLAQDTWVAITPNDELAGYAELRRDSPAEFALSVHLARDYQRIDVAAHLVALAEKRATACAKGTSTLTLTGRASDHNPIGRRTLESAGDTRKLSFLIMERVMTSPPESKQWESDVIVRAFALGRDEQATYLTDEEASRETGYHRPMTFDAWAKRMGLHTTDFDPSLWFLACHEAEIVGVALCFYAQATRTGWVDHLGVRRQWRNRGLGMALLRHSFGEFYRRGIHQVKLSVDSKSLTNAPRLYERAGMRTIQQYHIYEKELRTGPTS